MLYTINDTAYLGIIEGSCWDVMKGAKDCKNMQHN